MIARGYQADFYCDCAMCEDFNTSVQITAASWPKTKKIARKMGWRISKDETRAFAPGHTMTKRRKEDE